MKALTHMQHAADWKRAAGWQGPAIKQSRRSRSSASHCCHATATTPPEVMALHHAPCPAVPECWHLILPTHTESSADGSSPVAVRRIRHADHHAPRHRRLALCNNS